MAVVRRGRPPAHLCLLSVRTESRSPPGETWQRCKGCALARPPPCQRRWRGWRAPSIEMGSGKPPPQVRSTWKRPRPRCKIATPLPNGNKGCQPLKSPDFSGAGPPALHLCNLAIRMCISAACQAAEICARDRKNFLMCGSAKRIWRKIKWRKIVLAPTRRTKSVC